MSVEIILIPLAFAAVSAWHASRTEQAPDGRIVHNVASRMRNEELLHAALADTGADVTRDETGLHARWANVDATFARNAQGIWSAHLTGDTDQTRAVEIVTAVDAAYGLRVQQAVLATLRERASTAGMAVESETLADDQSVTLVLALTQEA